MKPLYQIYMGTKKLSKHIISYPRSEPHPENQPRGALRTLKKEFPSSETPKPLTNKTGLAHQPPQYFPSGFGVVSSYLIHTVAESKGPVSIYGNTGPKISGGRW